MTLSERRVPTDPLSGEKSLSCSRPVPWGGMHARVRATDALVVPVALMPLGRRWEIQVVDALDPRDFSSPDELHLALAAIHETFIMRAPDHLERPLRPGHWATVTRDGWCRE